MSQYLFGSTIKSKPLFLIFVHQFQDEVLCLVGNVGVEREIDIIVKYSVSRLIAFEARIIKGRVSNQNFIEKGSNTVIIHI